MAPAPASVILGPSSDLTPAIGTVFGPNTQLTDLLVNDEAVAALAKLVSERGVLFFERQGITLAQQKELMLRLGALSSPPRPNGSGLHVHPISEDSPELGADTSVISSAGGIARAGYVKNARASGGWHSDISFENYPSDYTMLKMHTIPTTGGDTLWASGYEAYDRLSPAYQKFLEGLTAEHDGNFFHRTAKLENKKIQSPRGHIENSGEDLRSVHPVIRTHPVTGWKTVFLNKTFTTRILELAPSESESVIDYLTRHVSENHDLQVRYRWQQNDVALWDNRCTFHTATNDYGSAPREGFRVVGVGEKPYFDKEGSKSRAESLNAAGL
ncbi:taurine catabolism dioxygenase [Exidia glandulosa HHB12029]|uniref:Taurine catabolism dioxygenase n=1 Tax=Exidia glandulosa HHB12029 TaxID=1314781 RepID=A0A165E6Y1_EXIGL|nr:taurine catabolism dioxygenase [Exidia glandulosa HHB12029]